MLAAAQQNSAQIMARPPRDPMVQIDWLPWHHIMGGNVVLHRLLRFGGSLYLDDGRPLPGRFEQTLANLREIAPSYYFNVPAGYAMLVDAFERDADFARHVLERLEFAYFGGAALPEDVHERLQAVALRILGRRILVGTAFGATETTAAVAMRTWLTPETASIGLPLPGNELKLVPDPHMPGRYEVRARGPVVFERYLNARECAAEAFDAEGFYSLGDAVRFADPQDPSAGLLFNGRFAEDFKLSNGTWVRTTPLRSALLQAGAPLVKDAVIVGEGRDHVSALVWLDASACRARLGLPPDADMAALVRHDAVLAHLGKALAAANGSMTAASMRLERLLALEEPPSGEAYELTDKGSINQRAVVQRRREAVEALYARPTAPGVVRPCA
jgi:feruloyl-CoA synthase